MNRRIKRYLAALAAVLIAIVWAFPVYWMINSSFLTPLTISALEPTFVPFGGTLQNYREVTTETPFVEALTMSLMVVAVALVVCIAFATLAALAISRFRFKGRKTFVLTIILVQMLPAEAMFIAQYKMISGMGLLNSLAGISIIYIAMVVPFTIWMLRSLLARTGVWLIPCCATRSSSGTARIRRRTRLRSRRRRRGLWVVLSHARWSGRSRRRCARGH